MTRTRAPRGNTSALDQAFSEPPGGKERRRLIGDRAWDRAQEAEEAVAEAEYEAEYPEEAAAERAPASSVQTKELLATLLQNLLRDGKITSEVYTKMTGTRPRP